MIFNDTGFINKSNEIVQGQSAKLNTYWQIENKTLTCNKLIQCILEIRNYKINTKEVLGSGAFGFVGNILSINLDKKPKVYKQSDCNLKNEFEISQKWENKTTGLSIHPKAYFPTVKGLNNFIILHKYHYSLRELLSSMSIIENFEAICQLSQGLVTLHSLNIVHNDIKEENVMLDKYKSRFDFIDFGLAESIHSHDMAVRSQGDLMAFRKLIFKILGSDYPLNSEKNFSDLLKRGMNEVAAERIIHFFTHLPKDANEILLFFQKMKFEFGKEPILPPLGDFSNRKNSNLI